MAGDVSHERLCRGMSPLLYQYGRSLFDIRTIRRDAAASLMVLVVNGVDGDSATSTITAPAAGSVRRETIVNAVRHQHAITLARSELTSPPSDFQPRWRITLPPRRLYYFRCTHGHVNTPRSTACAYIRIQVRPHSPPCFRMPAPLAYLRPCDRTIGGHKKR